MKLAAIPLHLIDRPSEAFRAVIERPKSWLLAAALLAVSMLVLLTLTAPYNIELANELAERQVQKMMADMSAEQADALREQMAARPQVTTATYVLSGGLAALAMMALGWVARGAVGHFSSMAFGGVSTWAPTFAVGVWSMLPFFFRDLIQAAWTLINGQAVAHQGLSFLVASGDALADTTNIAYLALAQIDLFAVWHIVLFGLGLAVATKLGKARGIVLAAVIWVVFNGLRLAPTLLFSGLM
jgi:hypothetical protein